MCRFLVFCKVNNTIINFGLNAFLFYFMHCLYSVFDLNLSCASFCFAVHCLKIFYTRRPDATLAVSDRYQVVNYCTKAESRDACVKKDIV